MRVYSNIRLLRIFTLNLVVLLLSNRSLEALCLHKKLAVIKDPIIEMSRSLPVPNCEPVSPEVKNCRRAHQGLYNEVVHCIQEQEEYVQIAYDNVIYGFDPDTKKVFNTFWTQKKHLTLLSELEDVFLKAIPHTDYAQEPTIVLIYPWKEFSVGTRFKHILCYDTPASYAIQRIDYATNTIVRDFVPHENAIIEIKQNLQEARKLFVKIINNLIDNVAKSGSKNVIAYVWGGSSFVCAYQDFDFYQKDGAWHRERKNNYYTGYDCSEFVMRMAHIAGLKFPWKTTAAISRSKRILRDKDQLEEGDLIWLEGHVMIISNIERNEIIEARGYTSGYGSVHRLTLSECFEGIITYNDLLAYYHSNKKINIKNREGKLSKAQVFKILKLID